MLTLSGLADGFATWISSAGFDRVQFLLIVMVAYLILGMFMDPLPILLLTVPLLIPILNEMQISLLWFGVFAVFMGELGILTPPVGILSFIIHNLMQEKSVNLGQKVSLGDVFAAVAGFMPIAILVAVLLIVFRRWPPGCQTRCRPDDRTRGAAAPLSLQAGTRAMTIQPPALSEARAASLGAALIAVGPVALTVYTPTLPALEIAFSASQSQVQMTVIIFFVGFTLAQLAYGPLSDAFGRRKVALAAVGLYALASLFALFANDIGSLTAARLVQGFGAAVARSFRAPLSGTGSRRRDPPHSQPHGAVPRHRPGRLAVRRRPHRAVSRLASCFQPHVPLRDRADLGPVGLPAGDERSSEPLPRAPREVLRQYAVILLDPRFLVPTLTGTLIMATFFAVSTVLPYVLIGQVGLTPSEFGLYLLMQPASFTLGTLASGRLMLRINIERLVPFAMGLLVVAAVAMPFSSWEWAPASRRSSARSASLLLPRADHARHMVDPAGPFWPRRRLGCVAVRVLPVRMWSARQHGGHLVLQSCPRTAVVPSAMILAAALLAFTWRKRT